MVLEVKRRGVHESNNIDYAKQHHTPHCWLPAKVMYPSNSNKHFSWLTRSTSILFMMNVLIHISNRRNIFNVPAHLFSLRSNHLNIAPTITATSLSHPASPHYTSLITLLITHLLIPLVYQYFLYILRMQHI